MTILAILGIMILLLLDAVERRRAKRTTNVDGYVIRAGHPIPRDGLRDHDEARFS
jgi:hypothetical protein